MRFQRRSILVALSMAAWACGSEADDESDASTDITAPTLTLTSPPDGALATGTLIMAATASDEVGVVSVSFRIDGVEISADDAEPYEASWDTTRAINGNYVVSGLASDAAGNTAEASATVYVENEGGPNTDALSMITPADGATVCGRVTVQAAATLDAPTVVFSLDGTDVASDSAEPFIWDWNTEGTPNGTHSLRATATGSDGLSVQNTIFVDVQNTGEDCDNLPSIVFTAPESGAYVSGDVALAADASDDAGVVKVQFFVENGMLYEDNAIPFGAPWVSDDFAEGPHTLKAIATDTFGQTAETQITVSVDRTAPTVSITSPDDADTLEGSVNVDADVVENLALESVVFTVDGVEVYTQDVAPFTFPWDTTVEAYGVHTIEVTATDRAGNVGTDSRLVTVDNPPAVLITAPGDGDDVSGQVTVTASASDDSGSARVVFYLDGGFGSSDDASPYEWTWDTCGVARGSRMLEVIAQDDGGHTVSDAIAVNVNQPLEVELVGPLGSLFPEETLEAYTSDDDEIVSVVWDIDGTTVRSASGSSGTDSCSLTCDCDAWDGNWDVTTVAEGAYTLTVTATNSAGDTATDSWSVTVDYDDDDDGYDGESWGGNDCDDANARVNPAEAEDCSTVDDDNCDGDTNEESATGCTTFYADVDGDGYGDSSDRGCWCSAFGDYAATTAMDCDDANAAINPGESEICDGVDNDCNGSSDDTIWYADADGDGYGDSSATATGCFAPSGYVSDGTDCDDSEAGANPTEAEVCADGIDNDCDGSGCTLASASLSTAVQYTGEQARAQAGSAVAAAGDVNGDGFDDMLVGAGVYDNGPRSDAGSAYLVLGSVAPAASRLSKATLFAGEADSDYAGYAVSGAGDVNGDSFDDMLVGASFNDDGPGNNAGAAYLLLGSAAPASASLSTAIQYTGQAASDYAGDATSGAGDVNDDGYADMLVGASGNFGPGDDAGAAYLLLGSAAPASASLSAAIQYSGSAAGDGAGNSVSGAGDADGDGHDDMLIGAPYNDDGPGSSAGAAYLLFGSSTPASTRLSLETPYTGEAGSDAAGSSVSGAGDVNGDGYDDMLVGAPANDDGGSSAGAAYLLLGSTTPASASLSTATQYTGEVGGDRAGEAVSGAGDVNNDGYDDMVIGASYHAHGGSSAGAAYLLLGSAAPATASLSTTIKYTGEADGDRAGCAVAGSGDMNADGYDDLIVGALFNDDGPKTDAGAAYLILSTGL